MGSQFRKISGLVLPADSVISYGKLKKQVLFFDEVILSDPLDCSLIADGEINAVYPDMTIFHAAKAPFVRQDNYEAAFNKLIADTESLQRRGILKILRPEDWRAVDPNLRNHLYESAIADARLVRSAIPDYSENKRPKIPDGIIHGLDIVRAGWYHIPHVRRDPPYKLHDVDDDWNHIAYLRIGRAIKYVRVAQIRNAIPVAWDNPSNEIMLTLGQLAFRDVPTPESLAGAAIALDVIETRQIEDVLEDISWADVLKIRREILPHIAEYRYNVIRTARRIHKTQIANIDQYRKIVETDRQSLDAAREELHRAWQGLRIIGSLKGLAAVAGAGAASLLIPTADWTKLLGSILTGVAIGAGTLANEIKTVLQTRNGVMKHPLFVLDRSFSEMY